MRVRALAYETQVTNTELRQREVDGGRLELPITTGYAATIET